MSRVVTAGENLAVSCDDARMRQILAGVLDDDGNDGNDRSDRNHKEMAAVPADPVDDSPTVRIRIGADVAVPPLGEPVTRGVWRSAGGVLVQNACSSGFDLLVQVPRDDAPAGSGGETIHVSAHYRPSARTRAANRMLSHRFWLLARQTLVQYPALWAATLRGGVPLHAGAYVPADRPDQGVLLIGPGGIGKSTALLAETAAGARAVSDNLCVWRQGGAHGVVEPMRVEPGAGPCGNEGRRTSEGRRERSLPGRITSVTPRLAVLLRRGDVPAVRRLPADEAARALVAGTYCAGELRRFWPFAASLALATGRGPAHPDVAGIAAGIAAELPCYEVCLGTDRDRRLTGLLARLEWVS